MEFVEQRGTTMARLEIGKYLATDTRVCGGRLIFKGSRILVSDIVDLATAGYTPNAISEEYRGLISPEAVREALSLLRRGVVREIVTKRQSAA
ncbi:MAG: DUF433 domain-containing protein [Nitrospirota bacterium]